MPPPYKLLLFDFDGTLVDTVDDIAHYVNEVLVKRGYPAASVAQVKDAVGWGVHELLKILQPSIEKSPDGLDQAVEEFKKAYRSEPVRSSKPFADVVRMLEGPLKDVRKSIVTNKPQDITLRILDELDLRNHFQAVIGTLGDFPAKPDPTSVLHLIERAGVLKKETVYIGDSAVDGQTSAAADIDFAWMEYGYQGLEGTKARFKFSSARDWGKLIS